MTNINPESGSQIRQNLKFCLCCLVCVPLSFAIVLGTAFFICVCIPFLLGCLLKPIVFLIRILPYNQEFMAALPWILNSILLIFLCGIWGCLLAALLSPGKVLKKFGMTEEKAEKISNRVEMGCFFIPGSIVAFFLLQHFLAHS
jgi:hypothetical protein